MAREDWHRPDEFSAPEGRRRVAVELSYDGRKFAGWQIQDSMTTVQQTVTDAVKQLTGQDNVEVCGSGRTDSGVHAFGQVAHIEMDDCSIPVRAFCQGLNAFLPSSVLFSSFLSESPFDSDCSALFVTLFSDALSIQRIICPPANAYDRYSEILSAANPFSSDCSLTSILTI